MTMNSVAAPRREGRRSPAPLVLQGAVLAALLALAAWLVHNATVNLTERRIASGFGFLAESAGFAISEGLVPYDMADSHARAFAAGVANTLRAAVPAVLLMTVLGLAVGIGQVARHPLLRPLARAWVDVLRNVPLLVQVLLWYFALTHLLPDPAEPMAFAGGALLVSKAGLALLAEAGPFGPAGGLVLSPEWMSLVAALAVYGSAYAAEIVRAGIEAVPRGQWEAGHALGLRWGQTLRHAVLPQGLRVMVPPYASLVMNTTKNSSLAVAIGYPDIVSVATTALNQNGQAIECIAIIAAIYLGLNLLTAWVMGVVNRRVQIRER
jgi:general L-amino acid transport system permease protein